MQAILASGFWRNCSLKPAISRRLVARALFVSVFTSVFTAGCSTLDFAYSMGPTALTLMADNYLDLDGDQETTLKERLLAVRESARMNQLAEVGKLFAEVRTRVDRKVTLDDVIWLTAEGRRHWKVLGTRVAGDIAELAPRLQADNIAALKKKLARNNTEYTKETIETTPEKQREKRFERVKENFERWYGNFDDAQIERMKALSDALPMNPRLVLGDRVRRQNAFVALLSGMVDKSLARPEAEARLATLLTELEQGRSAEYQAYAANYLARSQTMTVEIANLATPEQRATAQRRFKRWADDMANLAARKEP